MSRAVSLAILLLISIAPLRAASTAHRALPFATRDHRPLHLDLFLPDHPGATPAPLVIWMHGGAWAFGHRSTQFFARKLTREGFAVATIGYRPSFVARFPAQLDDCRDALRWLRKHAREYGLDPDRIYLSGASAGGHLAALLALEQGRSRVRAVFLMYPPTDLTAYAGHKLRFGFIPLLLGGPIAEKQALARRASPVNHVHRHAPPFYILHGRHDIIVPLAQSETLHQRLRAAGVESHLVIRPNSGHGFAPSKPELRTIADFFRTH